MLLLLRPKNMSWAPGKWALPGGHIEEGEPPMMAAVREVREETTLEINNPREFHISDNGEVVYFTTRVNQAKVQIDWEHDDFAWTYPEDLTNYDRVVGLAKLVQRAKETL